jgi:hypothetical protein
MVKIYQLVTDCGWFPLVAVVHENIPPEHIAQEIISTQVVQKI